MLGILRTVRRHTWTNDAFLQKERIESRQQQDVENLQAGGWGWGIGMGLGTD